MARSLESQQRRISSKSPGGLGLLSAHYKPIIFSTALTTLLFVLAAHLVVQNRPPLIARVDMAVSTAGGVELFVNDLKLAPYRQTIKPGVRTIYEFKVIPAAISLFRLDPIDVANAQILLYGITISSGTNELLHISPAQIAAWPRGNLSEPRLRDGFVEFTSSTGDPMFPVPLRVGQESILLRLPAGIEITCPLTPYAKSVFYVITAIAFAGISSFLFIIWQVAGSLLRTVAPQLRRGWAVVAIAAVVCWAGVTLQNALGSQTLTVDMSVSQGDVVEVFLNTTDIPPLQLPVVPHVRTKYHFPAIPHTVRFFRLDPTDRQGAIIRIYGLAFEFAGREVLHISPSELVSWGLGSLTNIDVGADVISMTSSTSDPMLSTELHLSAPGLPDILQTIGERLVRPDGVAILFFGSFVVFLVCGVFTRVGFIHLILVALVHGLGYLLVGQVTALRVAPPSVHAAVGLSGFVGYPKFHDHLAAIALLGLTLLIAAAATCLPPVLTYPSISTETSGRHLTVRQQWAVHTAILLGLALLYQPDLAGVMEYFRHFQFSGSNWDTRNLVTWAYMVHKGYLPYRDFWYPYAGFYLESKPMPFGQIAEWASETITFGLFYLGLFFVTGRRILRTLAILVVVLIPLVYGAFYTWTRYLLAIDFGLVFLAVERERSSSSLSKWVLTPVAAYIFFMEPAQLVYAVGGIALYVLSRPLLRLSTINLKSVMKGFIDEMADVAKLVLPVLAGIISILAWLFVTRQLVGFIDFQRSLGVASDYGAIPVTVLAWMSTELNARSVFIIAFYLLAIASYEWFRSRGEADWSIRALLILCGSCFLGLQKQILRPGMAEQLLIYPAVGSLLYAIWIWPRRTTAQTVVAACFIGILAAVAIHANVHRRLYTDLSGGFHQVSENVRTLAARRSEFQNVNASRYSREHFEDMPELTRVVTALSDLGLSEGQKVYVLGDDPLFYVLLNQDVPYQIDNYSCSPIQEQQKVLQWLHRNSPRFVIWNPSRSDFDYVPHVVRLPLVYDYIVEHFVFTQKVGEFAILRQKTATEQIDSSYWASQLGASVQLGHIPALTHLGDYPECNGTGAGCGDFLVLRLPSQYTLSGSNIAVQMQGSDESFTTSLDTVPDTVEYVIRLDRLWFWNAHFKNGPTPRFIYPPGAQLRLVHRQERNDILY
jgi:hypothetical protein